MKKIVLIALVFLIQGCISSKFVSSKLLDEDLSLSGKTIKAYNTLDIRTEEFGEKMLASLNQQIISIFENKKIITTVLNFKDSKVGSRYMVSGSGTVPIEDFVDQYESQESEEGVNYRLLVIPSQMTVSGAWRFFNITWILEDVKTGLPVWKGISRGEHLVQFHINEMPEKRASLIVESLFSELEKSNVF